MRDHEIRPAAAVAAAGKEDLVGLADLDRVRIEANAVAEGRMASQLALDRAYLKGEESPLLVCCR